MPINRAFQRLKKHKKDGFQRRIEKQRSQRFVMTLERCDYNRLVNNIKCFVRNNMGRCFHLQFTYVI